MFVSKGLIDNKLALVQVIARRRIVDKAFPESTMKRFSDAYRQVSNISHTFVGN